ncbi:hypothetical protein [Clostridium cibarium]|nr:hypothetical protein [Clostridium cibarium]
MDKLMTLVNMFNSLSTDMKMFIAVIVVAGILSKLSTEPNR